MLGFLTALIGSKGRYVFLRGVGGWLGPQRGGSSLKVSTKRGGSYLFIMCSRGGTHLFQNFLMRIFVMLLSIFGIHIRGNVFC